MKFSELVGNVRAWLEREQRVSYRALKREFDLDDETLEDLKAELIQAKKLASDEAGAVLVWVGKGSLESSVQSLESQTANLSDARRQTLDPRPISYTPQHLAERIRAEQAALEARGVPDGERKTITALFADLKGSTALIEGLDPEEARAIIDPALQLMMDAVHRYDGYVAQALGDGIFALFGAPIAHEDHPQRALYAALRMQDEMRRYADTLRQKGYSPLLMRVGLNTGEVVVRSIRKDDLHTDYVPVGHSTNLAARMEQLAAPGSILVTEQTHRLTDGYFEFKALGKTPIKGVEVPLNVYEVLGAGPLRTRLQVSAKRGLTRFVGRQSEMEQIKRALDQAKAGHGQIVGVMGEAGLGKSRLFYEFKLTSQGGYLVLESYSVSHGKASPYLPIIELLKTYVHIQPQDDDRSRRERVLGKVLGLDRKLEDTLPYLFALLSIEDQHSSLQQMDPQIRRRRTFAALKKLFLRESLNQPLMLIFEDLHWIDSETQGFLDTLGESVASARILLLVNYRPEYRHEWGSKTYYTQLRLAPLGKDEAEEFLTSLLGDSGGARQASPLQALKRLILAKTEATPFFMEEVVQELFEQGILVRDTLGARHAVSLPTDLQIPTTVQGVLSARMDRLPAEEKTLLQTLAVIGREFSSSLLRKVIEQPEGELLRLLARLQAGEFVYEQPAFPEVEYIFKHALTQEVAYNSLLIERRKILHERTAQAIEEVYRARLEDHYSELAHHYSRSGNTQKAVDYLYLAGQQAVQRAAYSEAINHLTSALELLKTLPETIERKQQELTLQLTRGAPLMATKGYSAPEVEQAYTRARELCQQVGETPQLFRAIWGLWFFYRIQGDLKTVRELGEQILSLVQSQQDTALLLQGHFAMGASLLWMGDFAPAQIHFDQGLTLYDFDRHRSQAFLSGFDPGALCLTDAALTLWFRGYPDQARKRIHEAFHLAQRLSHPESLVLTLQWSAMFYQLCGEADQTSQQAEATKHLAVEHGLALWEWWPTPLLGWAAAQQGRDEEGIRQMREGLTATRAAGANFLSYYLALLAEGYGRVGQVEAGLDALAEALGLVNQTEERWYEAELYRLRGELTLAQSRVQSLASRVQTNKRAKGKGQKKLSVVSSQLLVPSPQHLAPNTQVAVQEAEACFLKAISIAQHQQAKSFELRAVMGLVRLGQQQATQEESRNTQHASHPKLDEAHTMLSEVYNWFTEGFDTKDLQEAKALLEELSR